MATNEEMVRAIGAVGGSSLDELIARIGSVSAATPRRHAGIAFDPRSLTMGGTGDSANIDYRGFQAYMQPSQFRRVNPRRNVGDRPESDEYLRRAIDAGEPIGNPILYVRQKPGAWAVEGHEGRGRMLELARRNPSALYPVGIHPYGEVRARHLTPERLFDEILPDTGGWQSTRPDLVLWQNKPYVRPGQEENEAVLRALRELLPQAK